MPGWELHDGAKTVGPMSEQALVWAIKRGLSASARVRPEGQEAWIALDDHAPFAAELVARSKREADAPKRSRWTAYTGMEFARILVVLFGLVVLVVSYEWLEAHGDPYFHRVDAYLRGVWGSAGPPLPQPKEGAVKQAAIAASVSGLPPKQRAKMAIGVLNDASVRPAEAICRARAYVETLSADEKKIHEVAVAISNIQDKEQPLLRNDLVEFRKTRGILCGDGTKPKDCPCAGSHESCCVLHKGVQGCEPEPTHIRCD